MLDAVDGAGVLRGERRGRLNVEGEYGEASLEAGRVAVVVDTTTGD